MRRRGAILSLVVSLLAGPGCTSSPPVASVPGADSSAREVSVDLVPSTLAGLTTFEEDIRELEEEAGADSYLSSTRLWSLREGERLRATLQVGRLVPDAGGEGPDEEEEFRLKIVAQIGQSEPRRRVLGGDDVYVTVANAQPVYIWFRGGKLHVLSVDSSLGHPRALLREALGVGR